MSARPYTQDCWHKTVGQAMLGADSTALTKVGRCTLPVSKPTLNAPTVLALEAAI